jgi:hypothetical protein
MDNQIRLPSRSITGMPLEGSSAFMRPYNGHGWAEDDDDEPVFLSVNGGAPMQLTYPNYTIAHVNDCTQRARQRLCYPNMNSKPYGYKHGDKTGDNASKQTHKHKAMSAAASKTSRKRRNSKKKSSPQSSSSSSDDHSIDRVDAAIFTLVRLSPDIVLTSGRANLISSVFKGDYHIFVGNYPVIYRQIVNNPFLDPNIITVPSYSLLAAPEVLGTLVLTAIEATVEVATRRRGDNTFIDQLNFFQSELLLNNNLTIRNTR